MIELAIAGALFLLLSGVLGLAVASALGARNEADVRRQLSADMSQGLSTLASGPYNALLGNTFSVPNACSGTGTGTAGQSCYDANGQIYRVSWGVAAGSGSLTTPSTALIITATSTLASGGVLSQSQIVRAPAYDYTSGDGVLRVQVIGSPSGWNGTGPVYLVEQSSPTTVVATGSVVNGVAVLEGNPASCTLSSPCVMGLSAGNEFAANSAGTVTEIPSDAWGTGSAVVLTANSLTDATMNITGVGTATLTLDATNTSTAQSAANTVAGSVCLYLNFNDGVAQQSVPFCNFTNANQLSIATYAPDPAHPSTIVPLPVGTTMHFSTDNANNTCPYVTNTSGSGPAGTQGLSGSSWANEAVCTSWTWGNPYSTTINAVTTPWASSTLSLSGGTTVSGSINWSGLGLGASAYVADTTNNLIRMISPGGQVSTWAGTGTSGLVNGAGTGAEFAAPASVAVAADGTVYVADTANNVIRMITPLKVVSTLASGLSGPQGLALDPTGTYLYVANTGANQIDRITTATGAVAVLAGNGTSGLVNGAAASAEFAGPRGVAYYNGTVYVADTGNNVIRAIAGGTVSTLSGNATAGLVNGAGTSAEFHGPVGVTTDASGNVYVADTGNNVIREVTSAGATSTFAGNGTAGLVNGSAASAEFNSPGQLFIGLGGILYVADTGNNVIRTVTSGGTVSTLAGTGSPGAANGADASASFSGPQGITTGLGWVSGQPAIGFGAVSVWSGPRLVQTCSSTGTCTSIGTTVPENTACPGQDCYSGTAPLSAGFRPSRRSR